MWDWLDNIAAVPIRADCEDLVHLFTVLDVLLNQQQCVFEPEKIQGFEQLTFGFAKEEVVRELSKVGLLNFYNYW